MNDSTILRTNKVTVTPARFVVGTKSYVVSSISSVDVRRIDETSPKEAYKLPLFGLSLLALVQFLYALEKGASYGWLLIPLIGSAGLIWWRLQIKEKIRHALVLTSNSGEVEALSSYDPSEIISIRDALHKAIDARSTGA